MACTAGSGWAVLLSLLMMFCYLAASITMSAQQVRLPCVVMALCRSEQLRGRFGSEQFVVCRCRQSCQLRVRSSHYAMCRRGDTSELHSTSSRSLVRFVPKREILSSWLATEKSGFINYYMSECSISA